MKRTLIIIIIVLLMLVGVTTPALDWQSLKTSLVDKNVENSKTVLTLKDAQNQVFKVTYQDEEIISKMINPIVKYKNEFYKWHSVRIKELNFVVFANILEVVIFPQEIKHNNLNLVDAIPAGITMTYYPDQNKLRYDFRIMKDNQTVRIVGEYLSEDELMTKVFFAYDDPLGYLQRTDPEYLNDEIDKLKRKLTELADENEKIRQTLIYFYNEDWYNHLKPVPTETIKRIVNLKRNNKDMNKSKLWKVVKKEKINITKREFDLIITIYFNEF